MSVRMMSLIWDRFPEGGSARLVMLALADHANDGGTSIYPSVPNLAAKTVLSSRRLREVLAKLLADEWIDVVRRGQGGNPEDTTEYRLNVERLRRAAPLLHASPRRPRVSTHAGDGRGGVRQAAETPATGRTQNVRNRQGIIKIRQDGEPLCADSPCPMEFTTKGGTWELSPAKVAEYARVFAPLNVDAELRKAALWCDANPRKRKTARGMPAFLTRWLTRAAEGLSERATNNGDLTPCRDFTPEEAEAALLGPGGQR